MPNYGFYCNALYIGHIATYIAVASGEWIVAHYFHFFENFRVL